MNVSENLGDLVVQLLPKLGWAIALLILTRLGISLTGQLMRRLLIQVEPTLRKFFVQVSESLVLIVGAIAALNAMGIETTTLIAILGTAGLAIGLALQNTLSHFAAGVMLVSFRPFEVGDLIEGAGVSGVVDSIGIFSTTLLTPDHAKIVVPNNNLFTGTLKNLTAMGTRRLDLEIDIGDRPIEATMNHLMAVVRPHPLVLDQPVLSCIVVAIAQDKTLLSLRPWCAAEVYEQARSEIQLLVQQTLSAEPDGQIG